MNQTWDKTHFERLVSERNYIAAYQYIRMIRPAEPVYSEYAGTLVGAVIEELGRVNKREQPDRVVYLRSILAWIFRDIPGLSSLYREQLRGTGGTGDPVSEVYRGVRNFNDMASGRKSFSEGFEDAFQQIRDNVERTAEQIRERYSEFSKPSDGGNRGRPEGAGNGGRPDVVNEFLRSAEKGITEGLKQVGEFFENARRSAERDRQTGDPSGSRDSDVHAEDESGTTIRVDIVDEEKGEPEKGKKPRGGREKES
ncbi:MAG TPA: hypothetical protein VMW87_16300 [Spirochaetia bacterium]|nr:hypothetical protein [Spirochaetia bacterium]